MPRPLSTATKRECATSTDSPRIDHITGPFEYCWKKAVEKAVENAGGSFKKLIAEIGKKKWAKKILPQRQTLVDESNTSARAVSREGS